MTNTIDQIKQTDANRSEEIARILSRLPEKEQEKIYYMIKGVELAGANRGDHASREAV